MKLISLNTWGGIVYQPLMTFLREKSKTVDIFCFQEVFHHAKKPVPIGDICKELFSDIASVLPGFSGFFAPAQEDYGLAVFVRDSISITAGGDVFIYRRKNAMVGTDGRTIGRNLQYIECLHNSKTYTIANIHGLWTGGGKGDTPERIEQSEKIKAFLDVAKGAKILCGDFNLWPDTKSIAILEEGMRNLIKEHNITSTRSHYYTKKRPDTFADYMLVSPDVRVKEFRVLQDVVSDHLPLFLDFR